MSRFADTDPEKIEPLLRLGAAIGLAETIARYSGLSQSGTIRRNLNKILLKGLSDPD